MKYSVQGITLMNVVYTVGVGETTDCLHHIHVHVQWTCMDINMYVDTGNIHRTYIMYIQAHVVVYGHKLETLEKNKAKQRKCVCILQV